MSELNTFNIGLNLWNTFAGALLCTSQLLSNRVFRTQWQLTAVKRTVLYRTLACTHNRRSWMDVGYTMSKAYVWYQSDYAII